MFLNVFFLYEKYGVWKKGVFGEVYVGACVVCFMLQMVISSISVRFSASFCIYEHFQNRISSFLKQMVKTMFEFGIYKYKIITFVMDSVRRGKAMENEQCIYYYK